jgi:3-oxoacyl-[acyl-carrier-protein] synthase-1
MSAWVVSSSVISPLGFTSEGNYSKIRQQISGLSKISDTTLSVNSFFGGHIAALTGSSSDTKFESLCKKAAEVALDKIQLDSSRTLYILSTTKGNIELLNTPVGNAERLTLHATAKWLAGEAGFQHSLVVSNACISGVLALIVGKRFLDAEKYDHVVVVGADVLSPFVITGFESLNALSSEACKPFDAERKGINLGEAAAAVVLSSKPKALGVSPSIKITGGGLSNDANHISGPSRTGMELGLAVQQALKEAQQPSTAIDFISAHGTATVFNDEMEAKAFHALGMGNVPMHSLKGYFGHTLGAAGVVETIMSMHSLLNNEVLASQGFDKQGVSVPINICKELIKKPLATSLKTASGFGGCNAAIILQKESYSL